MGRAVTADLNFKGMAITAVVALSLMVVSLRYWLGPCFESSYRSNPGKWLWVPLAAAVGYTSMLACLRHRALMATHLTIRRLPEYDDRDAREAAKAALDGKRALYKLIGEVFAAMSVVGAAMALITSFHTFDARFLNSNAFAVQAELRQIRALNSRPCDRGMFTKVCASTLGALKFLDQIEKKSIRLNGVNYCRG